MTSSIDQHTENKFKFLLSPLTWCLHVKLNFFLLASFKDREMQDLPPTVGYLPRYDEDSEKDVRYIHV